MPNKKRVVALIFGGRSAEHEVSLRSAAAVLAALDTKKYTVRSIYIGKDGRWKDRSGPPGGRGSPGRSRGFGFLPWQKEKYAPHLSADIYFPLLHGPYGEDGTIQGLLEMAGVPYVGAGVLASAAGMDKAVTKSLLRERGLPIVRHVAILERDWRAGKTAILRQIREDFVPPLFVKPANLGSSVGITKVGSLGRLSIALATAFRYDRKILVEEGIDGREFECSVLGNDAPRASLPGEVIPSREFYDYRDKYLEGRTRFAIPAKIPERTIARIRSMSIEAFKAIDGSGMARVDFFLESKTNRLFINEINTIPGFTEISMYPKLWTASGLSFPRLLDRLITLGFEKHREKKACVERTG